MADLKQAMIWLAEGKKVRRKNWPNDIFMYLKDGQILAHQGRVHLPESDDWEIYKAPLTLSDLEKKVFELEKETEWIKEKFKRIQSYIGWP